MKNTNTTKKVLKPEIKERIVNAAKFMLFTITVLMGFWAIYAIVWYLLGLPINTVATCLLFIQAVVSDCMFYKWLAE